MSRPRIIMFCGGGTAGHITPNLAVAESARLLDPSVRLMYVGPRGDVNAKIVHESPLGFEVYSIFAGKFRRYHNRSAMAHLLDVQTNWLNFVDLFKIGVGFIQAFFLLLKLQPDVIFAKGGFVVVPLCMAARILRVPYMTHDSDMVVGLANRIIAKGAVMHAVANKYVKAYPVEKTIVSGVPLQKEYYERSGAAQVEYKKVLGIPKEHLVLLVVAGTQGAKIIDDALEPLVPKLLSEFPKLEIVHILGRLNAHTIHDRYKALDSTLKKRLHVKEFVADAYDWIAASDVILARAGATSIAEFSAIGRAVVVVPAAALTGGQQVKNAAILEKEMSARVVHEETLQTELYPTLQELLSNPEARTKLADKLRQTTPTNASRILAAELLEIMGGAQAV